MLSAMVPGNHVKRYVQDHLIRDAHEDIWEVLSISCYSITEALLEHPVRQIVFIDIFVPTYNEIIKHAR